VNGYALTLLMAAVLALVAAVWAWDEAHLYVTQLADRIAAAVR